MNICICGGGSLGHVCAGVLASQTDVRLNILTGHPDSWGNAVTVTDLNSKEYVGHINRISSDAREVAVAQDIILLCLPGFMIEKTLRDIKPYIGEAVVGSVVSSTGFFFFAHDILGTDARLFGFQRVPFIARVAEYGHSARLLGYKPNLAVAVENVSDAESFAESLSGLFHTPTTLLHSFYEAALTNSNPILHTGRLYTMFCGRENEVFDHNILFYEEWTDEASAMLIAMDEEFFRLLNTLNIHSIPTLLDYYESTDAASLTRKIRSITAFKGITSPMKQTADGWTIDFTSRYFTEDFPYGLHHIYKLAKEHNIPCPNIEKVYRWGSKFLSSITSQQTLHTSQR